MLRRSMGIAALAAGGLGLVVAVQGKRFNRRIAREAHALWTQESSGPERRTALEALPPPVRRYAEASGAASHAPVRAARLRHGGTFRPRFDRPWLAIRGVQYFASDPPGFVWWGRVRTGAGLWIDARDRSLAGEGGMRIMLASCWKLADVRGREVGEASLQRLLAEMVWFPTAFLDARHVRWAPIDDTRARAILRVRGLEVAVDFHFDANGVPSRITAERYRDVDGEPVLTPWTGECSGYRVIDGMRVPFRLEASWHVRGRTEPYARFSVDELELDRPEAFPG
ncbi:MULTISPECIES: DUF6544 family protein [Anaeromyxobacter]|uniref:DUF6544 family protein n=1 Tax=Anaeromyxobacter TaxID=161492 RepID=UPI001F57919C|nr:MULTISPECIES: DUF6544 family protein [unclassified Anaeromyxobacter]